MKLNNMDTKDKLDKRRESQSPGCAQISGLNCLEIQLLYQKQDFLKYERSSEFLKLIYAINLAKTIYLILFQDKMRCFRSWPMAQII